MGLSRTSTGKQARLKASKPVENADSIVLLAGNPNVGKSTLFNRLTGLKQHTGNWTGKTVACAEGICKSRCKTIRFVDLPGCYSLSARSEEEELARDSIVFGSYDAITVVCDASCLQRNLYLAIQILEYCPHVSLCINLEDEATAKGIYVNAVRLSSYFGIPVIKMSARKGRQAFRILEEADHLQTKEYLPRYPADLENYIADVSSLLIGEGITYQQSRVLALRLLDEETGFAKRLACHYGLPGSLYEEIKSISLHFLATKYGNNRMAIADLISETIALEAEKAVADSVITINNNRGKRDRYIDRLLIGRLTAFPIMLLLLFGILWLTVKGANYPSALLSEAFGMLEKGIATGLAFVHLPTQIISLVCEGVLRVVGWVIAVMLPPMAIFFPLFTLLEDIGYLPRIAFNLDRCFKGCSACGKQGLTMCMGLGCNATGVVGCRIIDSPREKLLAILTNSFMPCNGRFPMLIAIITIFFATSGGMSALILAGVVVLAIAVTLVVCKLLSATILKGVPSSFLLELPPYRKPQVGQILIRSIFDRTLFVLGRAIAVAAPTGLAIWLLANLNVGDCSLLTLLSGILDPLGHSIGLDGVILLGFLLGLPANEIVIPIILMSYLSGGSLTEYASLTELKSILISNGWTSVTAINMILFTVFHWPCSTTILTIYKETRSIRKTFAAIVLPTAVGILLCLTVKWISVLVIS